MGEATVLWARRLMRRPGSLVERNDFRPQVWHIQSPNLGAHGTRCGRNVLRFYSQREEAPPNEPPEGKLCVECVRLQESGEVRPQGRGPRKRRL